MKTEEILEVLVQSARENGLVETLYAVFGRRVKVRLPLSTSLCHVGMDQLDLSPRAEHSLKRAGVFTVARMVELIEIDGLLEIRNLGKKTQNEIKTKVLVYFYHALTDGEKRQFFRDLLATCG